MSAYKPVTKTHYTSSSSWETFLTPVAFPDSCFWHIAPSPPNSIPSRISHADLTPISCLCSCHQLPLLPLHVKHQ